jgi:two-component system response regulator AlgR
VEFGDFDVVGDAGHGEQALALVDELLPDIVLLDVRMPGIDGLEVACQLSALAEPPAVIFTTAFDEYALQAFDSQAIAYLLKPIRAEKLKAALSKAGRLTRPQLQQVASAAREPAHRSHIGVRGRDGLKLIPVEDVLCFHADQKYTTVKHLKGEDLIEDSLKTLEEEFSAHFVRIHRNALVNTRYLERIARDASGQHFVHLRGMAEPLEVSRRMAGDLKDRFRI